MKLIINDNNFTDIGTAVFYSTDSISKKTYSKVLFRSSSSLLYNMNFSEYDFSYNIEKNKFNDKFLINNIGNKTVNLFNSSPSTLEKLEKIIFPTLGNEDWEVNNKYFGTTLINNQVFALLFAEAGISKIELYKDFIKKNTNYIYDRENISEYNFIDIETIKELNVSPTSIPYFTILLGETDEDVENNLVLKKELEDEVSCEKAVWMLISSNDKVKEVNLSYKSWIDSINPNRNMNKYLVRNDEYWSTKNHVEIVNKLDNIDIFVDSTSNTLLGNTKINNEKLLILNKKKSRVDLFKNKKSDYPDYYKYTTYKKGDKVYYSGELYESLSNNNFNELPIISTKWILANVLSTIKSIRIIVSVYPQVGGISDPIGVISIPSIDSDTSFHIKPYPGYVLNEKIPCLISTNPLVPLPSGGVYDYNVPDNIIIVSNWEKVLETNQLFFNFKFIGTKINLFAEIDNSVVEYKNWISVFNENNFFIEKLIIGKGENQIIYNNPTIDGNSSLVIKTNERAEIVIPELTMYSISEVLMEYDNPGENQPSTIYPFSKNTENTIVLDNAVFTTAKMTLKLEKKKVVASIIQFDGFEISNNSLKVDSSGTVEFKFIENEVGPTGKPLKYFKEVILEDDKGNSLSINSISANGGIHDFGLSTVSLSVVNGDINPGPSEGVYTLRIVNIFYNTTIKIIRK